MSGLAEALSIKCDCPLDFVQSEMCDRLPFGVISFERRHDYPSFYDICFVHFNVLAGVVEDCKVDLSVAARDALKRSPTTDTLLLCEQGGPDEQ